MKENGSIKMDEADMNAKKERLVYLDMAKGLAIFTVVYSHILLFGVQMDTGSWIINILRYFYLSGFFFISGYLFYKPSGYGLRGFPQYVWKQTLRILVPTIVVGGCYMFSHGVSMLDAIFDEAKMGYWFTFVLYMILLLTAFLLSLTRDSDKLETIVLFVVMIGCFVLSRLVKLSGNVYFALSANSFIAYVPVFISGVLCRKYNLYFNRLIENKWILSILFLITVSNGYIPCPSFIRGASTVLFIIGLLKKLSSLKQCRSERDMTTRLCTGMAILGKYTLEIYFLHYFLLFYLPKGIGEYLHKLAVLDRSLSFPEFIIIGSLSIAICIASILMAKVIKMIPPISKIALGK